MNRDRVGGRTRRRSVVRVIEALALLMIVLPLAGCFDFVEEITFPSERGGELSTARLFEPSITMAKATAFDPLLQGQSYRRQILMRDGAPVVAEAVEFANLDDFVISGGPYAYRNTETGGTVIERTWRRDTTMTPDQINHMKQVLTGHQYVLTMNFPEPFRKAHPVLVLGRRYYPDVSDRAVRWIVPLPELIQHVSMGDLVFRVDR
ncbi:MAG: hypothetical protein EXQ99_03440 [Alphaproteobacteria bacterium]|nr:hypothetical protein [Alphaproteobacteria bacterium]